MTAYQSQPSPTRLTASSTRHDPGARVAAPCIQRATERSRSTQSELAAQASDGDMRAAALRGRMDGVLQARLEARQHVGPACARPRGGERRPRASARGAPASARAGATAAMKRGFVAGRDQAAADAVDDVLGRRGGVERDHRQPGRERLQ